MNKKLNIKPVTDLDVYPEETENFERFTVKELPISERPYEKCERFGPAALSDAELIAVIIKTGTKGERSIDLAHRILKLTKSESVGGLFHLDIKDLMPVKGIGRVKAIQLVCAAELAKRMNMSSRREKLNFALPSTVAEYFMEDMRYLEQETGVAVFLDTRMNLISYKRLFTGTVNMSIMDSREILIEALKARALYFIVLHNHPSGDPTPSPMDIATTKKLLSAGKVIGISLVDHIIIGDNVYYSFKEEGLMS